MNKAKSGFLTKTNKIANLMVRQAKKKEKAQQILGAKEM